MITAGPDRYFRSPATTGASPESQADMAGGIEMFLVRPEAAGGRQAAERIGEHVAALGGVVFMATGGGAIIVGLAPGLKDALSACDAIGFVGGVSFAEDAPGLKALRQKFAMNAARQIAMRIHAPPGDPSGGPPPTPWGQRLASPRQFLTTTTHANPEGNQP